MFRFSSSSVISLIALMLILGACSANNSTPTAPATTTVSQFPQSPQTPQVPRPLHSIDAPESTPSPSPAPQPPASESNCTTEFLNAYASVAKAQDEIFNVYRGRQFPDFKIAQKACAAFHEKHSGVSCRATDIETGREITVDSSAVDQICQELENQRRLVEAVTASEHEPLEKVASNLRLKIANELLLNDILGGSSAPVTTPAGVSCVLKRDNPTGTPLAIADVYRVRLAVQFPKGNIMASYLWLDSNALVIECLKPGQEPVTVLDLKKALEDQAEITILPSSL